MTTTVQVTFDCADPHAMARFWAAALGYEKESHLALVKELLDSHRITQEDVREVDGGLQFADVSACRDPDGVGPRLFFQRVPEEKRTKNRVHLDLHVGPERYESETSRLESLGAVRLCFHDDRGGACWTMVDPEGNEFCVE